MCGGGTRFFLGVLPALHFPSFTLRYHPPMMMWQAYSYYIFSGMLLFVHTRYVFAYTHTYLPRLCTYSNCYLVPGISLCLRTGWSILVRYRGLVSFHQSINHVGSGTDLLLPGIRSLSKVSTDRFMTYIKTVYQVWNSIPGKYTSIRRQSIFIHTRTC